MINHSNPIRATLFAVALFLFFVNASAYAQTKAFTNQGQLADQGTLATSNAKTNHRNPAIFGALSENLLRFSALGELLHLRLEVIAPTGDVLFDSGFKPGNVLDWTASDVQGQRLSDAAYLCLVTVEDAAGNITKQRALLIVRDQTVSLRPNDKSLVAPAQGDAAGDSADEQISLTILDASDTTATAILAHDGDNAHLVNSSGGLTISSGNFFAGRVLERLRLTAQGNLGIGLSNPQVRLDVAGRIRASEGIVFPDGSVQFSAASKTLGASSLRAGQSQPRQGAEAMLAPDIGGTGTTGRIAKWQDGPNGILNDSNITEASGAIGINGTPDTRFRLDVNGSTRIRGSNPGFNLEGLRAAGNTWLFQTVDDDGRFRLFSQDNVNPGVERLTIGLSSGNVGIGTNNLFARLSVSTPTTNNGNNTAYFEAPNLGPNASNIHYGTTGDWYIRSAATAGKVILQDTGGNVGIGTSAPAEKLDVAGNVNVSGLVSAGALSGNGAVKWQTVSGLTQQALPNNGYIATNDAQVTITLPANPNVGDIVRVSATGAGGWKVVQNAGQSILTSYLPLTGEWIPRAIGASWASIASSADGTKWIAAAGVNAQLYTSTDSGVTWTPRESNRNWQSVASSADGTKLVAVVSAGQIYTSTDSGLSWTPHDSNRPWLSVASSADGTKLVAVAGSDRIYTSTDSGATWTPRANIRSWSSVASSADGTKLIAAADGLAYISTDSGVNWTQLPGAFAPGGVYASYVASSADGTKLVAARNAGQLFTSTDSGLSWTPRESSRNWSSVASSADGTRLIAAGPNLVIYLSYDSGRSWIPRESSGVRNWNTVACSADGTKLAAGVSVGFLYTSLSTTTSSGTTGFLAGGQFASVELQYVGSGKFLPLSYAGAIFDY